VFIATEGGAMDNNANYAAALEFEADDYMSEDRFLAPWDGEDDQSGEAGQGDESGQGGEASQGDEANQDGSGADRSAGSAATGAASRNGAASKNGIGSERTTLKYSNPFYQSGASIIDSGAINAYAEEQAGTEGPADNAAQAGADGTSGGNGTDSPYGATGQNGAAGSVDAAGQGNAGAYITGGQPAGADNGAVNGQAAGTADGQAAGSAGNQAVGSAGNQAAGSIGNQAAGQAAAATSPAAAANDATSLASTDKAASPNATTASATPTTSTAPSAPAAPPRFGAKPGGQDDGYESNESTGVSIVSGQAFEVFIFNERRTLEYAAVVNAIAEKCGIPTYLIIPPAASELFMPEKYKTLQNEQKPALSLLSSSLKNITYVDTYDAFLKEKDNYLYFKTDHHWTADGAFIAYEAFAKAAGLTPVNKSELKSGRLEGFLGSLYRQIYKDRHSTLLEQEPDFVRYYEPLYETDVYNYNDAPMKERKKGAVLEPGGDLGTNLYNVFFGGDMRLLYMRSGIANGRSIVVLRDSFGHAFLPFLANSYEHVYAIEPRYFESFPLAQFVADNGIQEMLIMNHSILATGRYWKNWIPELEKFLS